MYAYSFHKLKEIKKTTREMGFEEAAATKASSNSRESVIVVMDADRSKGSVDALDWALKHVVRPGDTVVVLGVLCELGKKQFCLPFDVGIRRTGIWEKLELSGGPGEINPQELEEEIEKKREQYHSRFQPFYRQCKKNEVKLEIKLAAGFSPKNIAVEEAKRINTRWIVLDSHLKKDKVFIYGHVGCNVAVMKEKSFATLMPSKAGQHRYCPVEHTSNHKAADHLPKKSPNDVLHESPENVSCAATASPQSPCWYPLSWRTGFPRSFSLSELEAITNNFSDENVVMSTSDLKIYQGLLQQTPVLIDRFSGNDERFWSMLRILTRVRHRNITNLVGYCCTSDFLFVLYDFPCMGTLENNLRRDDYAKNMLWRVRWYIALEIGSSLRYLHEECVDGPIVHLSVTSLHITFSHGWFATLGYFNNAKCLRDEVSKSSLQAECLNLEEDERLSVDVHDYGILLLELITGKSASNFLPLGDAKTLSEWALPLFENGSLDQLMDPRLTNNDNTSDIEVVNQMARGAFFCLKKDSAHRFSMSEVLAVVRGDKLAVSKC